MKVRRRLHADGACSETMTVTFDAVGIDLEPVAFDPTSDQCRPMGVCGHGHAHFAFMREPLPASTLSCTRSFRSCDLCASLFSSQWCRACISFHACHLVQSVSGLCTYLFIHGFTLVLLHGMDLRPKCPGCAKFGTCSGDVAQMGRSGEGRRYV